MIPFIFQLIFKFGGYKTFIWYSPYLEKMGYSWGIYYDEIGDDGIIRIWKEPCGKTHRANRYCVECGLKGNNQKDEMVEVCSTYYYKKILDYLRKK